jgi:DNA-binding NtrC family response regulator
VAVGVVQAVAGGEGVVDEAVESGRRHREVADVDDTRGVVADLAGGRAARGEDRQHQRQGREQGSTAEDAASESELFGHERGAFTGALQSHAGKIEQAAGGVLFLDEVGEMSPAVQAKFLRVLQEREFQRLGSTKTLKANVRIVAATNRDPRRAMESGLLREDLYYRLNVFEIHLPPLRDRPEDIVALAEAFLDEIGKSIGRPAAGISDQAREQLLAHAWPGNVRELKNAIERAVILCGGGLIAREHLPQAVARPVREAPMVGPPALASAPATEETRLEVVEREMLQKALARARDNRTQAAKLLGLSRGQLYSLMRRHGLTEARR